MTTTPARHVTIDERKLEAFLGQVITETGAAANAALVVIGDKLGLYRAMASGEPVTSAELAGRTGTAERYVREWLNAQAAGGYVDYDPDKQRYTLPPEHSMVLADEDSPAFAVGAFQTALGAVKSEDALRHAFATGEGVGWHEHDADVFEGCERFFRPGYAAHLVSEWIPALEGVQDKLRAGASVADVGCGHGASTLLMARAYPRSRFHGFDYHDASIEAATRRAADEGLTDRVRFAVASAKDFPAARYDLVCSFDCLHDMGDPSGAARHVREALDPDGTWLVVEPFASERTEENFTPVGRAYYAFSTLLCTPNSLSQEVGLALGAQAGEARTREAITAGGFTRFRRATETPFNIIYEARP
jgi:2-polyprenyl-3-methyl-5-hydroxy-6-metoxy-1,4-benzoquinol methylase